MVTEIKSPTYPESVADGTIANWVKKEGQAVKQDELIAEIETDKIVLEVLSPINGKISKILKPEGEVVNSGELIAQIEETSSHTEEEDQEDSLKENVSSKNENNSLNHGPAVRRMLEEYNLDPKNITGSGKDGRISKSDIKNYLENINKKPEKPIEKDMSTSSGLTDRDEERVPMSRMRSTIAKRLLSVTQETAMLTTFNEVDMKPIKDLRKKFGDEFQTEHGLKLGFMGFFVSASINALKKFPVANASSALKNLALEIGKIANDIRLMASGPIAGLAEIGIPAVHAGSSIMPGKVNPSLAECMNMVCFNVIGNDTAVSYAAQGGQFELNVMLPGMLKCVLESTDMLKNFLPIFSANLIDGLTANKQKLQENIENSPVIVTLLTPKIGYLKSAELFKESLKTGKTIRELVVSKKIMSNKEIDSLFK